MADRILRIADELRNDRRLGGNIRLARGRAGVDRRTWITQRHQDIRDLLAKTIVRRESLYSDFITESARLLVDAMVQNNSDPQKLIPLYALLSRIRLSSSATVLETTEAVIRIIVSTYPKPNLMPEQIESRAVSGDGPLRQFSDACRK